MERCDARRCAAIVFSEPSHADWLVQALDVVLQQIGRQIFHEEQFIADFLQINDASLTFADYFDLESYFRRQASRSSGLGPSTTKLVRGAMDLIFGFLAGEIKAWIDAALAKDGM